MDVCSDIELPGLSAVVGKGRDPIRIKRGPVKRGRRKEPKDLSDYLKGTGEHLWFDIPDKLSMMIDRGQSITYNPYPQVPKEELRAYLLGSGLGAALMQRGNLVLHANAVLLDPCEATSRAILCVGRSGAGKSTTAVGLMQRGHRILADDVCPITPEGSLLPGLARAKISDDTADWLGIATEGLERIGVEDTKVSVPLPETVLGKAVRPSTVFWLDPIDANEFKVERMSGVEKFAALRNNIYRPEFLTAMGLEDRIFAQLGVLAKSVLVFRITRPNSQFDLAPVLDAIETLA